MNAITEAIKNLEASSTALEKFANEPKNYNTDYTGYLEVMSWEMLKQVNQLKSIKDMYEDE